MTLALNLGATPVGDAYFNPNSRPIHEPTFPIELYQCQECGLAQLVHVVNPDLLYGHFTYRTAISLGLVRHFESYARDVLSEVALTEKSFVVDIGSNDGSLLKFFKHAGHNVLGIDPARDIAQEATNNGIETWATYFNINLAQRIKEQFGKADLITTNNTFANIDDIHPFVDGIRSLLADKGTLVLETGYLLDHIQNGLFDNIYHEHLSYFPLTALIKLFSLHQLSIIHAERIPTKGGSIRVYVQHNQAAKKKSHSLESIIKLECNILSDIPYKELTARLKKCKTDLAQYLNQLNATGKSVAGYGASVGSTTFLYYFELGKQLEYLIDDNAIKHGLVSPGLHLPVLSFADALKGRPDYILIISWRYADAIIAKSKEYLHYGGRIINAYPQLSIIDDTATSAA